MPSAHRAVAKPAVAKPAAAKPKTAVDVLTPKPPGQPAGSKTTVVAKSAVTKPKTAVDVLTPKPPGQPAGSKTTVVAKSAVTKPKTAVGVVIRMKGRPRGSKPKKMVKSVVSKPKKAPGEEPRRRGPGRPRAARVDPGPKAPFARDDTWDMRFLKLASHIASWSKDPSSKVGCIIVGCDREIRSTGFNGLPRGILDSNERLCNRKEKYPLMCHAEENAIMHAARIGVSVKGCAAFVTWPPCCRCARSFVQAGLTQVVYPKKVQVPARWKDDFACSVAMLREAGLTVRQT